MSRVATTLTLALCGLAMTVNLAACRKRPPPAPEGNIPFVFRSLNLRQQDPQGRPSWQLSSPEARYDLSRRVAKALRPQGVIFGQGKPLYRLFADSGTVINDGEVILLEGGIRVEQLGAQPVLIRASRVRWLPPRNLMLIDRHPEAIDSRNRLSAQSARFLLEKNRLELIGRPQLEHWSQGIDPLGPVQRARADTVLQARTATWEPRTGALLAEGPLKGERRPEGAARSRPPQTLTAVALSGNTIRQEITLQGAVSFRDPAAMISFDGRDVNLDGRQRRLSSDRPFLARHGSASVRGDAFRLLEPTSTVEIPLACSLNRPGESLRAQRCQWNWKTQDVVAQGQLIFERPAQRQETKGEWLRGRLGDSGQLEVLSPGGRVVSRFQVPRGGRPARAPLRRQAAEPVRL